MTQVLLVAVTGGPGAGKTAVIEVVRKHLEAQVVVLPEAASLLYGGGFPRGDADVERRAAQHAIFHVQRQLERIALARAARPAVVCDRGTIDGYAYWPGSDAEFWEEMGSSRAVEIGRYAAVVHLRTPPAENGYVRGGNPLRIETPEEALAIDARIVHAWAGHPRRTEIPWSDDFLLKVVRAVDAIRDAVAAVRGA
jgi:predicted ATPase